MIFFFGTRNTRRRIRAVVFACARCGVDRDGALVRVRRWFHIFFIPLIPIGQPREVVQCDTCRSMFDPSVLQRPTTESLTGALRRAQQHLALVAVASGPDGRVARSDAARRFLAAAGWAPSEIEPQVDWASAGSGEPGPLLADLDDALREVGPSLTPQGAEQLVMSFGDLLIADGTFSEDDRRLVARAGQAVGLTAAHVEGITSLIAQRLTAG